MDAQFFDSPGAFGSWLRDHHDSATELWVGYWKKGCDQPTMTWPESVLEALCYGWIDGVRKRLDDQRYKIRFTPRKASSIWSAVNIRHVETLLAAGRMQPAGMRAFEARTADRSVVYSYERKEAQLDVESRKRFQANRAAWKFFESQSAWYQHSCNWWVVSAKQEKTRARRLDQLISDSAQGKTTARFTRTSR